MVPDTELIKTHIGSRLIIGEIWNNFSREFGDSAPILCISPISSFIRPDILPDSVFYYGQGV